MRNVFSKFALTAALGLAITFTFSCSGDDSGEQSYDYCVRADNTCLAGPFTASTCNGQLSNSCPNGSNPIVGGSSSSKGGGGSSGSNGQGVPFNENSQLYVGYWDDDDVYHISTVYNINANNGIIKMSLYDEARNETLIDAGSVKDGIVKLELPQTIPDEYLEAPSSDNCTTSSKDIKIYDAAFVLIDNDGEYIGELNIMFQDEQIFERIVYSYFSKAGKITCILNAGKKSTNLDAKAGWNKVYHHRDKTTYMQEYNTNNILTKEVKWTFEIKD